MITLIQVFWTCNQKYTHRHTHSHTNTHSFSYKHTHIQTHALFVATVEQNPASSLFGQPILPFCLTWTSAMKKTVHANTFALMGHFYTVTVTLGCIWRINRLLEVIVLLYTTLCIYVHKIGYTFAVNGLNDIKYVFICNLMLSSEGVSLVFWMSLKSWIHLCNGGQVGHMSANFCPCPVICQQKYISPQKMKYRSFFFKCGSNSTNCVCRSQRLVLFWQ